jgi:hypothetical protein
MFNPLLLTIGMATQLGTDFGAEVVHQPLVFGLRSDVD